MDAWGRDQQVGEKVKLLADGNATFAKALGLELDATGVGLGTRSQRFAMVVEDSVVKGLHVEQPGAFEVSSAEAVLATRSEEHTSELQSLMRISYAVFCLKKKNHNTRTYAADNTKRNMSCKTA